MDVEVTFPAYSLGPYARGETRVRLDYGELRPFLPRGGPLAAQVIPFAAEPRLPRSPEPQRNDLSTPKR